MDAESELTGLAMNNVFAELGIEGADSLAAMGFGGGSGLGANSIYNDRYADEYAGQGEDFEDEIDRELAEEMQEEDERPTPPTLRVRPAPTTNGNNQKLRGEDDYDFDEDDDEDEEEVSEPSEDDNDRDQDFTLSESPEKKKKERKARRESAQQPKSTTKSKKAKEEEIQDYSTFDLTAADETFLGEDEEELTDGADLFGDDDAEPSPQQDYSATFAPDTAATADFALDPMLMGSDQQAAQAQQQMEERNIKKAADAKRFFPKFVPGQTLELTDMLTGRPRKRQKVNQGPIKLALPPSSELPDARSTQDFLREAGASAALPQDPRSNVSSWLGPYAPPRVVEKTASEVDSDAAYGLLVLQGQQKGLDLPAPSTDVALDNWDERDYSTPVEIIPSRHRILERKFGEPLPDRNELVELGEWDGPAIFGEGDPSFFTRLQVHEGDSNLVRIVEEDEESEGDERTRTAFSLAGPTQKKNKRKRPVPKKLAGHVMMDMGLDVYNMSNDKKYEDLKESKKRVRQTFGSLEVLHSWPALKLQLPFYRTSLNKSECRSYHRPGLQFPLNIPITFNKVRTAKKKKEKNATAGNRGGKADNPIKNTDELSIRDTSQFVLMEYSEEYPPMMANLGMGSILVNYYRKKDPKDEHPPKADLGEQFLLDATDESPFLRFGTVDPGQMVQCLYNNIQRAPVFRQATNSTDFLVIKTTVNGDTKYYIREIKNLFVVGQTYPVQEVPGPHSRKITTIGKARLQAVSAKLTEKSGQNRVKMNKLLRFFPESTELQMRQKIKDFLEYTRKGPDQGYWAQRTNAKNYEEVMRDLKPEDVVLAEAMLVGQRHLLDLGYGKAGEEDVIQEEDESKMDIEQLLAPWIVTKNFLQASQSKAMLKLHGEGDPSGRGEGFSFLRVSMKDIFLREGETMEERQAEIASRPKSGHKYNVQEQQVIYREEVDRIWRAQMKSLSSKKDAALTQEDEYRWKQRQKTNNTRDATTPSATTPAPDGGASPGQEGNGEGSDAGGEKHVHKILKIKRVDKWGHVSIETVRDPAVASAYVRQRSIIEEEMMKADELMPTDDAEKNERLKKKLQDHIANLKHNQDRRMQRKNMKAGVRQQPNADGSITITKRASRGAKQETTRKCGNCGQIGHMKTNRKCPRYAEFHDPNKAPPEPAGSPKAATPASTLPPPPSTVPSGFQIGEGF